MPRKDGTGPSGQGPGTGRGQGSGRGQGGGRGRMGGKSAGPGGDCVCPKCNARQPHQQGLQCTSINCPKCGTAMNRE